MKKKSNTARRCATDLSCVQMLVVLLFGAACLAYGIWSTFGILTEIGYGSWRTREKVTAEAQLRSVAYREPAGGGRGGGGRGATEATYEYQVKGQTYTGSRVAIFKETDVFYRPLSTAFRSHSPIRVYIDPRHPEFSVIDRDFAWWPVVVMVPFSLVFLVLGFLILWHTVLKSCMRL